MKKLILLFIFSFFVSVVMAQMPLDGKQYANGLVRLLGNTSSDEEKARINFLLSEYWNDQNDSVKASGYLYHGKLQAGNNGYLNALYIYYLALNEIRSQKIKAEQHLLAAEKGLSHFNTKEALLFRSKCWNSYATLQGKKDDHKQYVNLLLNKAIPLAIKAGDSIYTGKNYLNLAYGFKNMQDYPKAESFLIKAMHILENNKAPAQYLAPVYHTLSEDYSLSGKPEKAKPLLARMKQLLLPYPDSEAWLDYYAGLAMYLTVSEKYAQSIEASDMGIAMARRLKLPYQEQRLLLQKFYALYGANSFTNALTVLQSLEKYKDFMAIATNRMQVYNGFALTYEHLKDTDKAYLWLTRYTLLSDSVSQSQVKKDINALEIKYRNAENQKKILVLENEKKQEQFKSKNSRLTNWLLVAIISGLLVIFFSVIANYRNKRKLSAQKEKDYELQLKSMEQQRLISTAEAMLKGEEVERRRVARDLHDGLGGILTGIKINLSGYANKYDHIDADKGLFKIVEQLDNSVSELRRIAQNMMPESLTRFGLKAALNDLCISMSCEQTKISFEAFDIEADIELFNQVTIYRIIQEGLANAIRHANASHILLQCNQNMHIFFITIEDNGKGFETDKTINKGNGLSNIENRVNYMHGKMEIVSTVNVGTTLYIELNMLPK